MGYGEVYHPNSTIEDFLHDVRRVNYIAGYLDALSVAIRYEHANMLRYQV